MTANIPSLVVVMSLKCDPLCADEINEAHNGQTLDDGTDERGVFCREPSHEVNDDTLKERNEARSHMLDHVVRTPGILARCHDNFSSSFFFSE